MEVCTKIVCNWCGSKVARLIDRSGNGLVGISVAVQAKGLLHLKLGNHRCQMLATYVLGSGCSGSLEKMQNLQDF